MKKYDEKIHLFEFLETFTKGNLSVDIRASRLQSGNDAYKDNADSLEQIVDLVHSEGVWIVYGWVKRALINDGSLLGNDTKETGDNMVISQEISTHALQLHPLKKYHLDLSTIQGRSLDNPQV